MTILALSSSSTLSWMCKAIQPNRYFWMLETAWPLQQDSKHAVQSSSLASHNMAHARRLHSILRGQDITHAHFNLEIHLSALQREERRAPSRKVIRIWDLGVMDQQMHKIDRNRDLVERVDSSLSLHQ